MSLYKILHVAIVAFVCALPFMPLGILRSVYWLPVVFPAIWLLCDGCPLSKWDGDDEFLHSLLVPVCPSISVGQSADVTLLVLIGVAVLITRRFVTQGNEE